MDSLPNLQVVFESFSRAVCIALNCLNFGGMMAGLLSINKRIATPIGGSVLRILRIIPIGKTWRDKIVRAAGGMQEARTSLGAIIGFLVCFFTLFAKTIPLSEEDARRIIAQNHLNLIFFGGLEGILAIAMIAGVLKILRLD